MRTWTAPFVLALASCHDEGAPVIAEPPASAQATASAPAPVVSAPPTARRGPDKPERPLSDEEKRRVQAYRRALERGRALSGRKDYAAAIAALDEALIHIPGDPRALCERGYVRLLSGDLARAKVDLDEVKGRIADKDLASQVWFNLGLVEERRGHEEEARLSFARAFELKPTVAARDKLSGKTLCPIRIDRSTSAAPTVYPSWLAAWKALGAAYEKDYLPVETERPVDDASAKAAFHVDRCDGACVAKVGDYGEITFHLVFPNGDGTLSVVRGIDEGGASRCSRGPDVTLVPSSPEQPIHVVTFADEPEPVASCVEVGTPKESCRIACNEGSWTQRDLFFDRATRRRLLRLEQTGAYEKTERRASDVAIEGDGARPAAPSCGKTIPFKAR